MVSKIYSGAILGLEAKIIEVEVSATKGLRIFNIVGLPDKAVQESKERVISAIKNLKLISPVSQTKRILVNLSPANIKKEGTIYDLPIALGYLLATQQVNFNPEKKLIFGELSLDGKIKPIFGAFSLALLAKNNNFEEIILPKENAKEAALLNLEEEKIKVIGVESLKEAISYLEKRKYITPVVVKKEEFQYQNDEFEIEFGWIKGQQKAKFALEIAAAGGHNVFFLGPPGSGKTILAKSIISILPKLELSEIFELTKIYSNAKLLNENEIITKRPFRNPHHSASEAALIGGGNPPRAGEITLAHRGVLFLDEFPEFHRDVLESLRQPIEDGKIVLERAGYSLAFPAKFTLIAAANPCPCGYFGDPNRECTCTPSQIFSYRRKLSGPLIDRFDLFLNVPSMKFEDLISQLSREETEKTRKKIEKAREIQKERFKNINILTNSEIRMKDVEKYCQIPASAKTFLKRYVDAEKISARGYHHILKVARTIADLEERENILFDDVAQALSFRKSEIQEI
ncbi:MAG: YifB family Mg chelatase-like AAA ATPase [Minisyncoccia bacterium]